MLMLFEIEDEGTPILIIIGKCGTGKRRSTENHLPELKTMPESIADYDVVILGYPNYCSTIPMPQATFLDAYDFSGKKILPFCTK